MSFESLVAFKYLKSKRKDGFISIITWLSLIGIMLGVATLVIVMSVMNGFREEMMAKIMGMNGHVIVMPKYGKVSMPEYKEIKAKIESLLPSHISQPPVPMVEAQVMVSSANASGGAIMRGIALDDMASIKPLAKGLLETNISQITADEVLIGYQLGNKLGLLAGDNITITSPRGNQTAFGTIPRMKAFAIGATFKSGMSIYDSTFVFAPLALMQNFLDMEGKVSHIEVFLKNPDASRTAAQALAANLPGYRLYTWQEQNSSFVSALNVERNVMFIILTLIILVASFNIISSLVMLVKDKSRDIAVFRTLGATRGSVMRIFIIAGGAIGVAGTILGLSLGLVVSYNIEWVRQLFQTLTGTKLFPDDVYFLSELPSRVDYAEVMGVGAMSLLISFLATIYPSRKAAKLLPVEVLRYE
ncbi:MAG: lipoprotein-releasing ABC transporter permease subunit [Rickettsiales bacterium]|jgi:lipoprotein-releasing system permease protein|nr:lipoprotein-releasing ABC transporter permease subunit [Rickettsiales bacterium]